jgi:hypothetical protein
MKPVFQDLQLQRLFDRCGYVTVDLLDPRSISLLLAVFERFVDRHTDSFSATLLSPDLEYRRLANDEVQSIIAPRVASVVRDYRHVSSGYAVKRPDTSRGRMPLHQDITMVPEGGRPALSLWIPLVDVDEINGSLEMVAGSHRLNRKPRAPGTDFAARLFEAEIRDRYLSTIVLRAGQAVFMDQAVFHCSSSNLSPRFRPVAVSVLVPREQPLIYYHRQEIDGRVLLERFEVPDDFFLYHAVGSRPARGLSTGFVEEAAEPISLEDIALAANV